MANNYFPHYYGARNNPKILMLRGEYGNEGYAKFFMLVEVMAETTAGYLKRELIPGIAYSLGCDSDSLLKVIDKCLLLGLFEESEKGIFNDKLLAHKAEREFYSQSGKRGASIRWNTRGKNSPPINPLNSLPNSNKEINKEIYKEKQAAVNQSQPRLKDFNEWIQAYNTEYKTNFKSPKLISNFSYWRDSYTQADMLAAIPKVRDHNWLHDKATPELLLRRQDQKGNPVDRIGELLSLKSEKRYA